MVYQSLAGFLLYGDCMCLKKYILFVIICFCNIFCIYSFSKKAPAEFVDCIEIFNDKQYFIFYLKTNDNCEYYDLQIIGLNSKYIIHRQDFIDWNIETFIENDKFCFKIDKKYIAVSEVFSARIGLYNNKTLREELYVFMGENKN